MKEHGIIAKSALGEEFEVQVLKSNAGYYLGTQTIEGMPASRESREYWSTHDNAQQALDSGSWTQRHEL